MLVMIEELKVITMSLPWYVFLIDSQNPCITHAVLWEAFLRPPSGFSKIAARSAAILTTPYSTSFSHRLEKFQIQVVKGQVTRSS